jgi:UDP-glucose 4-epimerase
LAEIAATARFVYVSTTDVLPEASDEPLSEAAPCAPVDAYGRTKLEGERRLLEAHPGAVVLRPPGIYGPGATRDVVLDVARRIARRTFYYVGTGSARRSWIFVDNLVDAMLHVAEHPKLTGKFLVDDGRSVSRREFAEEIARTLGRRAWFPSIPAPVALGAAWSFERACPPLGIHPPATLEGVRRSLPSQPLDTTRWKATGFRPRFSLPEGIARTIRWEHATGRLAV